VRIEAAQHAILARVADFYQLKDLNSTNGTLLNVFYGNGKTKFRKQTLDGGR
jgi:pSer/pThr/pTyr-binding forkhead associated (FHA) protein